MFFFSYPFTYLRTRPCDPITPLYLLLKYPLTYLRCLKPLLVGMISQSYDTGVHASINTMENETGLAIPSNETHGGVRRSLQTQKGQGLGFGHSKPAKNYSKRTALMAAVEAGVSLTPLFVAEPPVVRFSQWEIGDQLTLPIMFRNISTIQRSLRVIPPGSGFFSMGQVLYPSGSHAGSVAAGIPVRTEITFYPNSLGDFADFIRVETEGGSYQVPVIAQREPPQLDIPSVLDLGACLVGDAMRVGITVTNTGGNNNTTL